MTDRELIQELIHLIDSDTCNDPECEFKSCRLIQIAEDRLTRIGDDEEPYGE